MNTEKLCLIIDIMPMEYLDTEARLAIREALIQHDVLLKATKSAYGHTRRKVLCRARDVLREALLRVGGLDANGNLKRES